MIHSSVVRELELVEKYGNEEERARVAAARAEMQAFVDAFGGQILRLEEITLPEILVHRAKIVARRRFQRVRAFSLENKQGVKRSFPDELYCVEGEFAACICCDLPFNHLIDHQKGKRAGNLGNNVSAHVAKPGNFSLIVGEKEPDRRRMVLMQHDGPHAFKFAGWIRAGDAKQEMYQRTFVREGVTSQPYVVPSDQLNGPQTWA